MPNQSPQNNSCDCCEPLYRDIQIQVVKTSKEIQLCGWNGFEPANCPCVTPFYRRFKKYTINDQYYGECGGTGSTYTATYSICDCELTEEGEYDGVSFVDPNCGSVQTTETTKITTGCCSVSGEGSGGSCGDSDIIPDSMTETLSEPWTGQEVIQCATEEMPPYPSWTEVASNTFPFTASGFYPIGMTCLANTTRVSPACFQFGQVVISELRWLGGSGASVTKGKWRLVFYPSSSCYLKFWIRRVVTFTGCTGSNEAETIVDQQDLEPIEWEGSAQNENLCIQDTQGTLIKTENLIIENEDGQEFEPEDFSSGCGGTTKVYLKIVKFSCIKGYEPEEIPFETANTANPSPNASDYDLSDPASLAAYKAAYEAAPFQRDCYPDSILDG